MATPNGHNSQTTSSIATKRGIGLGSVAFSDVIQFKSLSMKREARKVTEMVRFSCTKKGNNTVDLYKCSNKGTMYQQVDKGDEQMLYGRLRASPSLVGYCRLN